MQPSNAHTLTYYVITKSALHNHAGQYQRKDCRECNLFRELCHEKENKNSAVVENPIIYSLNNIFNIFKSPTDSNFQEESPEQ